MNNTIRVFVGRFVGAAVGALTGWAASKGVGTIDAASSEQLTSVLTNAAMLAGYGISHKLVNSKVNPEDSAKR